MNRLMKIIMIAILIPVAISFWPAALGGDTEFIIVKGQSMYPTILDGSLVVTKQSPPYQVGEIVAFYSQDSQINIVHRIIEDNNGYFEIQGDNNPKKDSGPFTESDILGEIVFATPYVGEMLLLLRNPMVLILASVVLVAVQMEQKRRKKKKEKLRRILLGLPKPDPKAKNSEKKPSKPSYSIFLIAMGTNILTFVITQMAIYYNIAERFSGDEVTGFLFRFFQPSFASTIAFCLYFVFIVGLFIVTKKHHKKMKFRAILNNKTNQTGQVLLRKNFSLIPTITQILASLFILMSLLYVAPLATQLSSVFSQ